MNGEAPELPVRRNADVLLELVPLDGRRVVDVGCGAGALVRLMAGHGAHVTGVECQADQLERARAVAPVADEDYVEGVAERMPIPDAQADVVVFSHSLHHVPAEHMATALSEAVRVLRPGGLLYVSEPVAEGAFFELVRQVDDETEVRRLAQQALRGLDPAVLEHLSEHAYLHPLAFADFEAFRDLVVSADGERAAAVRELDAGLRRQFEATSGRTEQGYAFQTPTRVDLFRRR